MTEAERLAQALERCAQGITLGAEGMGWSPSPDHMIAAAAELRRLSADAHRLDWLERRLFEGKWTGTIGQEKSWGMAGPYRHTLQQMRGETLRAAIDQARKDTP